MELGRTGEQVELGETNGTDGTSRIGELGGMKLELVSASGTGGTSGWKWLIGVFSDGLDVSFGYKVLVSGKFSSSRLPNDQKCEISCHTMTF